MSLTTHSEGQVSTVSTSPSSLSPSSTSSSNGGDRTAATSYILFSFLIVFLSVFGILMLGGIVGHYALARRRQILSDLKQCRLQKEKPEMWDVLSVPVKGQQKWRAMNPLSVQVDVPSSSKDDTHADEGLTTPTHPLTIRLAIELVHDVILHRPLAFPSEAAKTKAPPIPTPKIPTPGTDMLIAVLVAMPSPPTNIPCDSFIEKGDGESVKLREFVIGTIRTHVEYL